MTGPARPARAGPRLGPARFSELARWAARNTVAERNTVTWAAVFAGTITAIRAWQQGRLAPPWSFHAGGLLIGWGGFNLVEGLIDHQLLGIHHVRDDLGAPLGWDLGFLVFGVALVALGARLVREPAVAAARGRP